MRPMRPDGDFQPFGIEFQSLYAGARVLSDAPLAAQGLN